MISWMLFASLAAATLAGAAWAAEEVARLHRLPRRWGWLIAMGAAVTLPPLFRWIPARAPETAAASSADALLLAELLARAPATGTAASQPLLPPAANLAALYLWIALTAMLGIALVAAHARLIRLRRRGERAEILGVPVLLTPESGPMVVGLRRPEIVLPRWIDTLEESQQRLVVHHEWEHVRARDPILLLLAASLLAVMPWNLPLWWMRRRLRQALEVDCDARVLASGTDRRAYGAMLIHTAGRPGPASLLAPALIEVPTLLERRIVAMTSRLPAHRRFRTVVAAATAGLLFFAACEMTPRGGPTPTEPTLDDLVGPTAENENRIVAVDFSVVEVDAEGRTVAAHLTPDGRTLIARIDANGDTTWIPGQRVERAAVLTRGEANPLVLVDGDKVASLDGIDPTTILEVNVIKGPAAVEIHGPEAADGVIQVRTGAAAGGEGGTFNFNVDAAGEASGGVVRIRDVSEASDGKVTSISAIQIRDANHPSIMVVTPDGKAGNPIFFVDGVRVESIETIDPATIEHIEVIKDATALERFGPDAVHGAVLVTRKK